MCSAMCIHSQFSLWRLRQPRRGLLYCSALSKISCPDITPRTYVTGFERRSILRNLSLLDCPRTFGANDHYRVFTASMIVTGPMILYLWNLLNSSLVDVR